MSEKLEPEAVMPQKKIAPPRLVRAGAVVGGGLVFAYGLNALLNILLGRVLGPAQYSLFVSLLAVVLVVSVPSIGLQSAVAREVAQNLASGKREYAGLIVREALAEAIRWQLVLFLAVCLLGYPLARLLHVGDILAVVATALTIVVSLAFQPLTGALQGAQRFGHFSAALVANSLLKLALALTFGLVGFGVGGVMVGYLLAGVVATALVLLWIGDLRRAGARLERRRRRLLTRYTGSAAVTLTLFAIISNADVVVARLSGSLGHHVAGLYSAASMSSRLILTGSAAVVTVLFPRVSVLSDRTQERLHLRAGAATVALLGAIAVAVSFAWGEPLIRLAFGSGFSRSATWLGPLCIAMALYSVANVYIFHFLSLDRARLPLLLSGVLAIELIAFGFLRSSPRELVLAQVISAVALLGACELFEQLQRAEAQT